MKTESQYATVAGQRYRLVRAIPTNQGRSVYEARDAEDRPVLVKQAHSEEWAADIQGQTRQYEIIHALLGDNSAYPPIIGREPTKLAIPFYTHGSVDELSLQDDHELVAALTARALGQLFRVSLISPDEVRDDPGVRAAGRSFVVDQATKRLVRLVRALEDSDIGRAWGADDTSGRTRRDAVTESARWITDDQLACQPAVLGPPRLALAAHGDFGLNNVLLVDEPSLQARIVFIDTRAVWISEYPWWDPILDLATLLTFHCRIEPELAGLGEFPVAALTAPARLSEDEILALAAADEAFLAWTAEDPQWRARLEVHIAIRLLGSVSVQLLTAPQRNAERATRMFSLYEQQAQRVDQLLREGLGAARPGVGG